MQMSKFVLSFGLIVLSASAQLTTAVSNLGNGRSQVTLANSKGVPLEAFVATWVTTDPSGALRPSSMYNDSLLQFGSKTVPTTFTFMSSVTNPQFQVQAGIFQDGTTYGDPKWIAGIRARRIDYLQALDAFIADLRAASPTTSQAALVQQFDATRDQLFATARSATELSTSQALAFSDMFLYESAGKGAKLVYTFLVKNIRNSPVRPGEGMALPELLAHLIDMLTAQRLILAAHVA